MGHAWILLPVNDDRIGRRLISIATTFLLTTATEWAVKETGKWKKLALWEKKKKKRKKPHQQQQIKQEEPPFFSDPSTSIDPGCSAPQWAVIQEHTKAAWEGWGRMDKRIKEEEKVQQHTLQTVRDH